MVEPLTPERWRVISELFDRAMSVVPERRAALLDEACAGDAELRARLEGMIAGAERASGPLESPAGIDAPSLLARLAGGEAGDAGQTAGAAVQDAPPPPIGPYRPIRLLGAGGMGDVWLAEQETPIRRQVALKLIKAGMDTRQVIGRFETERQTLAVMDHPCIARVFDAGATAAGSPYFVMEYIQGEPITLWCDRRRLGIPERLALFMQVCEGVLHAHQKGIIHRDLKPSNVLVTTAGERPLPKIIDFGIAKATVGGPDTPTWTLGPGAAAGTPEYMSPEQILLEGADVDTRADVYSLGVILYTLLTGALPHDTRQQGGLEGLKRRLREDDPPRPSQRVRALAASAGGAVSAGEAARNRGLDPPRLERRLRGDLDWIAMKALEKDRARRYDSPAALADDLKRHLDSLPVAAGPPSVAYRAGKFLRRNRLAVAAATVLLAGLVAGLAGALVGKARAQRAEATARREAETSDRVSRFLADMLGGVDPETMGQDLVADVRRRIGEAAGQGADAERRRQALLAGFDAAIAEVNATDAARHLLDGQILGSAGAGIDKELARDPRIAAQLLHVLALTYQRLGLYEQAEAAGERALDLRTRLLGAEDPETLRTMNNLAVTKRDRGKLEDSETLSRAVLDGRRRVLGPDHPDTLKAIVECATAAYARGRYAEAEAQYREALAAQRRVLGEDHRDTIGTLVNVGNVCRLQNRIADATKIYEEVLEKRRRLLGSGDAETVDAMNNLANSYRDLERYPEAEALNREVVTRRTAALGAEHPDTLMAQHNLGFTLYSAGRAREAEPILVETVALKTKVLGAEAGETLYTRHILAETYLVEGRRADAERLFKETLAAWDRTLGKDSPEAAMTLRSLVDLYTGAKDWNAARPHARRLLDTQRRTAERPEASSYDLGDYAWGLLTALPEDLRDPSLALSYAQRAVERSPQEDPGTLDTLALAYHQLGRSSEAAATESRAITLLQPIETARRAQFEARLKTYRAAPR